MQMSLRDCKVRVSSFHFRFFYSSVKFFSTLFYINIIFIYRKHETQLQHFGSLLFAKKKIIKGRVTLLSQISNLGPWVVRNKSRGRRASTESIGNRSLGDKCIKQVDMHAQEGTNNTYTYIYVHLDLYRFIQIALSLCTLRKRTAALMMSQSVWLVNY